MNDRIAALLDQYQSGRSQPVLDPSDIGLIARHWIAYQSRDRDFGANGLKPDIDDPAFVVVLVLSAIIDLEWRAGLEICVEIAKQSSDPWVLEMLGASPLEDLLEYNGPDVLAPFLEAAKSNPNFRQALNHVWSCKDQDIWRSFLSLRENLIV